MGFPTRCIRQQDIRLGGTWHIGDNIVSERSGHRYRMGGRLNAVGLQFVQLIDIG